MLKNLKLLREISGITQKELGDIANVSQQSINKYENSSVEPDILTLIQLANFFEVSVDYLIGKTDVEHLSENLCNSYSSIKLSPSEKLLVLNYRKLSTSISEDLYNLIATLSQDSK